MVGSSLRSVIPATNDIELAQANASAFVAPVTLEQLDRRTRFLWRGSRVNLGSVAVMISEYGAAFSAVSKEGSPHHIVASFPLSSVRGEFRGGGAPQAIAHGRSTHLYSPPGGANVRFDTGYRGIQIMIETRELSTLLGALLGATLKEPLRFESRLSLERGVGPALERATRFIARESRSEEGLIGTPLAAHRFSEALLIRLLDGQRHNYTERLVRIANPASPRSVRLATEYLEANLSRAVRITELAAVAGISARALQNGFKRYRGCTPAEWMRETRLAVARARLLDAPAGTSIAHVARQCGFAHVGRFSASYRARFGELPNATRARRGP